MKYIDVEMHVFANKNSIEFLTMASEDVEKVNCQSGKNGFNAKILSAEMGLAPEVNPRQPWLSY